MRQVVCLYCRGKVADLLKQGNTVKACYFLVDLTHTERLRQKGWNRQSGTEKGQGKRSWKRMKHRGKW